MSRFFRLSFGMLIGMALSVVHLVSVVLEPVADFLRFDHSDHRVSLALDGAARAAQPGILARFLSFACRVLEHALFRGGAFTVPRASTA